MKQTSISSLKVFAILLIVLGGMVLPSHARDLTDVFSRGSTFAVPGAANPLTTGQAVQQLSSGFAEAVSQAVTQEFPLAAVAPAFTYRYNPAISVFERSSNVPGPIFSERAPTLGPGRWNLSLGYSYIDFSDFNGQSLHRLRSPGLILEGLLDQGVDAGRAADGTPLQVVPIVASRIHTRIDLNAHVFVPTLRYGLTDRWDVSLSIPVVDTFLRVKNTDVPDVEVDFSQFGLLFTKPAVGTPQFRILLNRQTGQRGDIRTTPFIKSTRPGRVLTKTAGSATGVGDITLRSKYHFWDTDGGGAAFGLNLQLPSGEVRDFHGTDETHVSPYLYLSQIVAERFEPHLNIGFDLNTGDVGRSSAIYAVGATALVGKDLGISIDFLGRHEFEGFRFTPTAENLYEGPLLGRSSKTCTAAQPCFVDPTDVQRHVSFLPFFPARFKRNDIADVSFGLRYALGTQGSVFFGGIVPLNDDGLRAGFIPSGGLEYGF